MSDRLLARLRALPDVEEAPSQWTRAQAFWIDGREFVHLHGDAIELRVTRRLVDAALANERVVRRTRTSDWVIVPLAEEDLIVELATSALEANRR